MKLNEVNGIKAGDLDDVQDYESGNLDISNEGISSLQGCPKEVTGDFYCSGNHLTSLEGCPEKIHGHFSCGAIGLKSFEYFPKYIGSNCTISHNSITSFKDIDQYVDYIEGCLYADNQNITSGYSDLFGIDGLQGILVDNDEISHIANKYLHTKDLIEFQDEMIKSGFESYL